MSAVGFCSGAIAGLVAITPGAGFVGAREQHITHDWYLALTIRSAASVFFGVAAGTICNFSTQLKFFLQVDDALDVSDP
jgi:ammonium transporter, Amt family